MYGAHFQPHNKTIAIAAGGTAGHINPALALAEELTERGYRVEFFGTTQGIEQKLVTEAGYALLSYEMSGINRSHPLSALKAIKRLMAAQRDIEAHLKEVRPVVAIGFGAYVSVPLLRAAQKLKIPTALHEQNSVLGLANKMVARKVNLAASSYPEAQEALLKRMRVQGARSVLTGNPVRKAIIEANREQARHSLGLQDEDVALLVFGGSMGARKINEAIAHYKFELDRLEHVHVFQATGSKMYHEALHALQPSLHSTNRWHVLEYIDDMPTYLAAADVVFSRAGASTIAELAARCVPAILAPFPAATEDHQRANAKLLTSVGAAIMYDDVELMGPACKQTLIKLVEDQAERDRMRNAATTLKADQAASKLADELLALT